MKSKMPRMRKNNNIFMMVNSPTYWLDRLKNASKRKLWGGHKHTQEKARRVRQIEKGMLKKENGLVV